MYLFIHWYFLDILVTHTPHVYTHIYIYTYTWTDLHTRKSIPIYLKILVDEYTPVLPLFHVDISGIIPSFPEKKEKGTL